MYYIGLDVSQEDDQLLREGWQWRDSLGRHALRHTFRPGFLDEKSAATVDGGYGSHGFYGMDLRSPAAARRRAESASSVDAAMPSPQESTASLGETLSWLTDFLPKGTGGSHQSSGSGVVASMTVTATSSLGATKGCEIEEVIEETSQSVYTDNSRHVSRDRNVLSYSLGDLDGSTVNVEQPTKGYIGVYARTRENSQLVTFDRDVNFDGSQLPHSKSKSNLIFFELFVDNANAQRAANALRHAAELCAKSQPF
jgi:hypothetical protein